MPQIMPPNMGQFYGFQLIPPGNWPSDRPFSWSAYLPLLGDHNKTPSFDQTPQEPNEPVQSLSKLLNVPVHRFFFNHLHKQKDFPTSSSDPHLSVANSESPNSTQSGKSVVDFPGLSASKPVAEVPTSALRDFFVGMKVEIALPRAYWDGISAMANNKFEFHEMPLCSATVIRAQGGLLWLLPDLVQGWSPRVNPNARFDEPIMLECCSSEIYPGGWSQANGHPFVAPMVYTKPTKPLPSPPMWRNPSEPSRSSILPSGTIDISGIYSESDCCPPIYINASCYSGPYLCKVSE